MGDEKKSEAGVGIECSPKVCVQGKCRLFITCDLKDSPQSRQAKLDKVNADMAELKKQQELLTMQTKGNKPAEAVSAPAILATETVKKAGRPKKAQ